MSRRYFFIVGTVEPCTMAVAALFGKMRLTELRSEQKFRWSRLSEIGDRLYSPHQRSSVPRVGHSLIVGRRLCCRLRADDCRYSGSSNFIWDFERGPMPNEVQRIFHITLSDCVLSLHNASLDQRSPNFSVQERRLRLTITLSVMRQRGRPQPDILFVHIRRFAEVSCRLQYLWPVASRYCHGSCTESGDLD